MNVSEFYPWGADVLIRIKKHSFIFADEDIRAPSLYFLHPAQTPFTVVTTASAVKPLGSLGRLSCGSKQNTCRHTRHRK